jgi:hypothetical protein
VLTLFRCKLKIHCVEWLARILRIFGPINCYLLLFFFFFVFGIFTSPHYLSLVPTLGLLAVAFAFAFDSMSEQRPFLRTPSVNRPMTLGSEVRMQIKTKGYSGGGSQGSSVGHLGKMTMGFLPGTCYSSSTSSNTKGSSIHFEGSLPYFWLKPRKFPQ